jgi:hypothetical protein
VNRENLAKLADYLQRPLPIDFDMEYYGLDSSGGDVLYPSKAPSCGTVACAVGCGPYAGIAPEPVEGWRAYSDRVFDLNAPAWLWLFSTDWSEIDNTPQGAAARIRWLLDKGLPGNWKSQMFGRAPLCYREVQP